MSDAQAYYDGMIVQGYNAEQATATTQQYFPEFVAATATPTPAPAPAAEPTPVAAPAPQPAAAEPMMAAPAMAAPAAAMMPVSGAWAIQTADFGLFSPKSSRFY